MPLHGWARVESGIFHAFHTAWITEIQNSLNAGLLPENYYALAEQHASEYIPDVLKLHVPLEATYVEAWKGMPAFWRYVILGNPLT